MATAVCVALVACGDSNEGDTGAAPSANAGASSGLGAERFKALDAVYVASLPLDRLEDDENVDTKAFAAATAPTVAACDALAQDDELLAAIRRTCPLITEFTSQLLDIGACEGGDADRCRTLIGETRRTVSGFARLGRRADKAVEQAGLETACQQALITPQLAYEVFDGYDRALVLVERGLRDGSVADAEKGERILAAADAKGEKLPSAKASLERFRSDCA